MCPYGSLAFTQLNLERNGKCGSGTGQDGGCVKGQCPLEGGYCKNARLIVLSYSL